MMQQRSTTGYPKAVVFDFDGVILESADIKTQAFLDLFSQYPQHRDAILRYHLDNIGVSRYRKFEWIYSELLEKPLERSESQRLGDSFTALVLDKILKCPFVPGALECLKSLDGRPAFVASGTPEEELLKIIRERSLDAFFKGVWGSPNSKTQIIRRIMSEHDYQPKDLLFVGDGLSDHEAAKSVGIPFVARTTREFDSTWRKFRVPRIEDLFGLSEYIGVLIRV